MKKSPIFLILLCLLMTMTALQVRDALDSVSKDNFGEFESTEWSVVFDQLALTATYYHRENYEVSYSFGILNTR